MACGTLNLSSLIGETFWANKSIYEAAECYIAKTTLPAAVVDNMGKSSLADEIARARQHIKNSLQCQDDKLPKVFEGEEVKNSLAQQITYLIAENKQLNAGIDQLRAQILKLENRVSELEKTSPGINAPLNDRSAGPSEPASVKKEDVDEDDIDLFGSDEDTREDEKEKLHQERLKAYEEKKSKKPAIVAKSNIILDVKPWDDETDMKAMEQQVRSIQMDGLVWGASKLVPLAYGIHKLQISCVVEDDIVSVDMLQEQIQGFEELVQSVDIAAFNKV